MGSAREKAEKAAISDAVAGKSKQSEYPFDSAYFDASDHHRRNTHTKTAGGRNRIHRDIDVQQWRTSHYNPEDTFGVEIFIVSHPSSHRAFNISRPTLISFLETAKIPPTFVEVLGDNNGVLSAAQELNEQDGSLTNLSLQVKVPLSPYINGSFYYRYEIVSKSTTVLIFFDERLTKRLECVLEPSKCQSNDPFLILSNLVSDSCHTIESSRYSLDHEVQRREASTGATLVVAASRNIAPIEQYPPLFDRLHSTQQQLMFMETALNFQVKLVQFLKEQHEVLTQLRQDHVVEAEIAQVMVQAQKVTNSLSLSLSQMENMLLQVQTLSLRIRMQLGIVESRLNQSNSRTQVTIAEETKRDGMAMKTIAALTMLFLPGTFTASFFSMPFFVAEPGVNGAFRVNHAWWLYVVVTMPLTVIVVLRWVAWLRYLNLPSMGKSAPAKSR